MEIWKTIEEYPDYQISSAGNVMSYKNGRKILRKLSTTKKGYVRTSFRHNGESKMIPVHQLVLKHFGPSQPPNTTPDHINRIKTDNRIENLRWATPEQQRENSVPAKLKGETNGSSKLTEAQVREIKEKSAQGIASRKIAKEYGVTKTLILYIRSGRLWSHVKI